MTELHQQLQDSIRELEQIRKIKEHIANLNTRLTAEQDALDLMEKTLEKEQRDVETLEREGLTTMFRKFIGDREEKLEKERKEYLKASLRYNELYKSVSLIQYELDLLSKKETNEEVLINRIDVQLRMREKEIQQFPGQTAEELRGIHQQLDNLTKFKVEIDEAYATGSKAYDLVGRTEQYLQQAQGWGQKDMWGGGRNINEMKHDALNEARNMAYEARQSLLRFENEVKDVFSNVQLNFDVEIDDFSRFGDILFDNLIYDFFAQQKISKSLGGVRMTRKQIEEILKALQVENAGVIEKMAAIDQQRREIILNAK